MTETELLQETAMRLDDATWTAVFQCPLCGGQIDYTDQPRLEGETRQTLRCNATQGCRYEVQVIYAVEPEAT